jgi:hypothetical protein
MTGLAVLCAAAWRRSSVKKIEHKGASLYAGFGRGDAARMSAGT